MQLDLTKFNKIIYCLLSASLFFGLKFNEDFGGGGSITDFYNTFPKIISPIDNLYELDTKFPLHYFLGSIIYYFLKNEYFFKIFFIIIAIYLPYVFYECLKIRYENTNKNYLFLLSLVLLILPGVRSAAIWPNTQLTSLFFFIFSIKYFLKWEKKKIDNINKDFYLFLFYMAAALYCREIYALIYLYFYLYVFFNFTIKNFLKVNIIILILALPGIIYLMNSPTNSILAMEMYTFKFENSILINFSILAFYLLPFFIITFMNYMKKFKLSLDYILFFILISLVTFLLSNKFNFDLKNGGGVFLKISNLLFNNNFLFYISSLLGILMVCIFAKKNLYNIFLFFLLIIGISGKYIFMKYFEPMFIILFFLVFKNTEIKNLFKKNNTIFYFAYFFTYFIGSMIFTVFEIKKYLFII